MIQLINQAFQRVPEKVRGWLYLGIVIAGLAYIVWTGIKSGLSVEQLVALLVSIVGGLANSNRPTVKARTARKTTNTTKG